MPNCNFGSVLIKFKVLLEGLIIASLIKRGSLTENPNVNSSLVELKTINLVSFGFFKARKLLSFQSISGPLSFLDSKLYLTYNWLLVSSTVLNGEIFLYTFIPSLIMLSFIKASADNSESVLKYKPVL